MESRKSGASDALLNPFLAWSELARQSWSPGVVPFPMASAHQRFAQCYLWFQKLIEPLGTPSFEIDTVHIDGESHAVTATDACVTPFCRLLAFRCEAKEGMPERARVLLVAPLAGHRAVLMRDAVLALLQHADVFVTDWADARDVPVEAGHFTLDDCVRLVERFIVELGPHDLDVVAVCQGTVPALASVSRLAEEGAGEPRTLTLIGGPLDVRLAPTMLDRMAARLSLTWVDAAAIDVVPPGFPGAGRRVYPGFLQYPALIATHPDRHFALMFDYFYRRQSSDAAATEAIEREAAQFGAVLDMTAEFFIDTLRVVFQQAMLPQGLWSVGGRVVRPDALRTVRLLTLEGACDEISGPGQTHAAHGLCTQLDPALRHRVTAPKCDHYDLFRGQLWRETIHPEIKAWMTKARAAV